MTTSAKRPADKYIRLRAGLILGALVILSGLVIAVWLLPEKLVEWSLRPSALGGQNGIDALNGVDRTAAVTNTRQGVLFAAGGLIAIISLVRTWLRHGIDREKQDLDRDSDHRARFAQASEQLGHERPAVRLAGVYTMAALADDWQTIGNSKQQTVCVDVLCAYLRMPYDPTSDIAKSGEKEVRLTIIKTISERLQNPAATNTWCGFSLDFTEVVFDGGNFDGAQFVDGTVAFTGARFVDGSVSFTDARFAGGEVTFGRARFVGGTIAFLGSKFVGGKVTFEKAKFTGGTVAFFATEFTGGKVSFSGAEFAGGTVGFLAAKFDGGKVEFPRAKFTGGKVEFNTVFGSLPGVLSFDDPQSWTRPPKVPWLDGETPAWVSPNIWPPPLGSDSLSTV